MVELVSGLKHFFRLFGLLFRHERACLRAF